MKILALLPVLLFCCCSGSESGPGDGGSDAEDGSNFGDGDSLGPGKIGKGDGIERWVTVGNSGHIFYSDDGEVWTQATNNATNETLRAVSSDGQNLWVAVGERTAVFSEDSAETWTGGLVPQYPEPSVELFTLYGLANDGLGHWGAAGHNRAFCGSLTGGLSWVPLAIDPQAGAVNDVATDGSTWMAACVGGILVFSGDIFGSWELKKKEVGYMQSIASDGHGNWVAVGTQGRILFSPDNGQSWHDHTWEGLGDLKGVASNGLTGEGARWVAVGGGANMVLSSNGQDWQLANTFPGSETLEDVATDGSKWIAVGANGVIYHSLNDGVDWSETTILTATDDEHPGQWSVFWGK